MAGIMERISDILESNIHSILNKCENPEKILEQNMRKALEDLAELKESAVALKADVRTAERSYNEAVNRMQAEHGFAVNAMKAGDEASAAMFLQSEARIKAQEVDPAQKNLDAANRNFETVQQAYNKLAGDIEFMKGEMNNIKGTIRTAKATEKVAAMKDPAGGYAESFSRYSEKAQRMLDEANARIDMNSEPVDELESLRQKYAGGMQPDMSAALANLRAECEMPGTPDDGVMKEALNALRKETGVQ